MKLVVDRFVYEPPGLSIIPETEYEAAVLARCWTSAKLGTGRASGESKSSNGQCYTIKFVEPEAAKEK